MSECIEHPENAPEYEGLKVNKGIEQPDPMNPNIAARLKNIRRQTLTTDDYVEGILKGNINILSQAITLVESAKPEHQAVAQEVINRCLPSSGRSVRIGITGVPEPARVLSSKVSENISPARDIKSLYWPSTRVVNGRKEVSWATRPVWKSLPVILMLTFGLPRQQVP